MPITGDNVAKVQIDYDKKTITVSSFISVGNMKPIVNEVLTFGVNDHMPAELVAEFTQDQRDLITWFYIDMEQEG